MTWIKAIEPEAAEGSLKTLYGRIQSAGGEVDNILKSHSLRPHTLTGHMGLYKAVLHHPRNALPVWFLETIGLYVSLSNDCEYCVEHHYAGLKRLLDDEARSRQIRDALSAGAPDLAFEGRELAALDYARKLTKSPAAVEEADIETLRKAGLDDGEILEINQVSAYFAYANRTVLGLGVNTAGDSLGLSPSESEDPNNFGHD